MFKKFSKGNEGDNVTTVYVNKNKLVISKGTILNCV